MRYRAKKESVTPTPTGSAPKQYVPLPFSGGHNKSRIYVESSTSLVLDETLDWVSFSSTLVASAMINSIAQVHNF